MHYLYSINTALFRHRSYWTMCVIISVIVFILSPSFSYVHAQESTTLQPKNELRVPVTTLHTFGGIMTIDKDTHTPMHLHLPDEENPFKEIHIDLGIQMMFLLENSIPVHMFPISSGKASAPTPVGVFQIHRKQVLRISSMDVPYRMPYYLAFTKDQAFGMHALPNLKTSQTTSYYWQETMDHIGTPVSHGCVRLLPADALALYEWAELGTPVHIALETLFREYVLTALRKEKVVSA